MRLSSYGAMGLWGQEGLLPAGVVHEAVAIVWARHQARPTEATLPLGEATEYAYTALRVLPGSRMVVWMAVGVRGWALGLEALSLRRIERHDAGHPVKPPQSLGLAV